MHNSKKLYINSVTLVFCFFVMACMKTTLPTKFQPLSDKEISIMSDKQLCITSLSQVDPRLDSIIEKKKLDCSRASVFCEGQGEKRGTKNFRKCISNYALESRRKLDPAWATCTDKGFKTGTQGMATCMATWESLRQQRMFFELKSQERQRERDAAAVRDMLDDIPDVKTTNCYSQYNRISCTTW